jgi:hypothetical protein
MPGNLSESENREKESNEQNMFRMGVSNGTVFHCVALVGSFRAAPQHKKSRHRVPILLCRRRQIADRHILVMRRRTGLISAIGNARVDP